MVLQQVLYRNTLAAQEQLLGKDDCDVISTREGLNNLLQQKNQFGTALLAAVGVGLLGVLAFFVAEYSGTGLLL